MDVQSISVHARLNNALEKNEELKKLLDKKEKQNDKLTKVLDDVLQENINLRSQLNLGSKIDLSY